MYLKWKGDQAFVSKISSEEIKAKYKGVKVC